MYGQGACGRKGATTTCAAHSNDRLKNYVGDISQECFQNDVYSSTLIGYRGQERHLAFVRNQSQTHDGKECAPWRNPRKANSYDRIEDENGNFRRVAGNHCRIGCTNYKQKTEK